MSQIHGSGAGAPRRSFRVGSIQVGAPNNPEAPTEEGHRPAPGLGAADPRPRASLEQKQFAHRAFLADNPGNAVRARLEGQLRDGSATDKTPDPSQLLQYLQNMKQGPVEIEGTESDDEIHISRDPATQEVVVRVGEEERRILPFNAIGGLEIDALGGSDRVVVDGDLGIEIRINGGDGDDSIDARDNSRMVVVDGGAGDDHLVGGSAQDLLVGGEGSDRIEGRGGNDTLAGVAGDDHLVGGAGDDRVYGGDGADRIDGNEGHDFLHGGGGSDRIDGGVGSDSHYVDADDNVNVGQVPGVSQDAEVDMVVAVDGSPRPEGMGPNDVFRTYDPAEVEAFFAENGDAIAIPDDVQPETADRIRADIGVLLGTEQGRGLLDEVVRVQRDSGDVLELTGHPSPGFGGMYSSTMDMATSPDWGHGDFHPTTVLFHELVHAIQFEPNQAPEGFTVYENAFGNETYLRNSERQAVGLPYLDANGDERPANELPFTENRFRSELGLPPRAAYSDETGEPLRYEAQPPPPPPPGPFPFPPFPPGQPRFPPPGAPPSDPSRSPGPFGGPRPHDHEH